jgi:signal transduction histidine kinase
MESTAIVNRKYSSTLRPMTRSAILSASFSAFKTPRNNPAGFVSALAHEIRNPLCNINLALELLNLTQLDEEQRQYLGIIMRGSGRIKDLVNRLLTIDLAKEVNHESYSLHQMLEEVLTGAKDRMLLKNISVRREYNATVHRVPMDPEKVRIALTNIVINAIEAMPARTGVLRLVTRSTDEQSCVEIHDNGIGISKEDLKRIFEPTFSNKPGGLGIGLSATMDILRVNHTGLDVRSEEGVGTSFILSFDRR